MKKYSNLIVVILSFTTLIIIFINKELVTDTIISAFHIWFNTLVPSMFPMFILSNILITYNFVNYLPNNFITALSKIFNISKSGVLILLLGLISGFPANAFNIKNAYDLNIITKEESEHLLLFNHFSNPLFILQTVGIFYLKNNIYGIIILVSHILANITIGIIFRSKNNPTNNNYISLYNKSQSFTTILSDSIKKTINTLLIISGTITLFLILSTLIVNVLNLNNILSLITRSILEITMALFDLSKTNIKDIYKVIFSSMIVSFGGLSIHMQVIEVLEEKIKYSNYIKGRIYQAIISGIFSLILMKLFF